LRNPARPTIGNRGIGQPGPSIVIQMASRIKANWHR
jgi:hypothetical protein